MHKLQAEFKQDAITLENQSTQVWQRSTITLALRWEAKQETHVFMTWCGLNPRLYLTHISHVPLFNCFWFTYSTVLDDVFVAPLSESLFSWPLFFRMCSVSLCILLLFPPIFSSLLLYQPIYNIHIPFFTLINNLLSDTWDSEVIHPSCNVSMLYLTFTFIPGCSSRLISLCK